MGQRVAVILITWNSSSYLRRCCEGIAGQSHTERDVYVVDNASTDDSVSIVRELLPAALIAVNHENAGYAAAVNHALRLGDSDYVLLLNPDVFLDPRYVSTLVEELSSRESFGSATGKLLRATGDSIEPTTMVDSKGIRMTRNGRHLDIGSGEPDVTDPDCREVFGVSGAAAFHRRAMLNDVATNGEVLDEDFFAWREDADLSWRAQLRGWRALYVPRTVAWHVRRVTPEKRSELPAFINYHSVKNRFLLRLKNQGLGLFARNSVFELFRDLEVITAALTIERSSLPALRWLVRNRRRILAKRRTIQARRTVADRDLVRWFQGR